VPDEAGLSAAVDHRRGRVGGRLRLVDDWGARGRGGHLDGTVDAVYLVAERVEHAAVRPVRLSDALVGGAVTGSLWCPCAGRLRRHLDRARPRAGDRP